MVGLSTLGGGQPTDAREKTVRSSCSSHRHGDLESHSQDGDPSDGVHYRSWDQRFCYENRPKAVLVDLSHPFTNNPVIAILVASHTGRTVTLGNRDSLARRGTTLIYKVNDQDLGALVPRRRSRVTIPERYMYPAHAERYASSHIQRV